MHLFIDMFIKQSDMLINVLIKSQKYAKKKKHFSSNF